MIEYAGVVRAFWLIVLCGLLAWGVVALFVEKEDTPPIRVDAPEPPPEEPVEVARTGTLHVRVQTPDGKIPFNAQVGYEFGGQKRYTYANKRGQRVFTDAPAGTFEVVGRAPGHHEDRRKAVVTPGLRTDVVLVLRPRR